VRANTQIEELNGKGGFYHFQSVACRYPSSLMYEKQELLSKKQQHV